MKKYNVNEIDTYIECNLLNGILRPAKHMKTNNTHYYPILHGCMNTRYRRAEFNNLQFF